MAASSKHFSFFIFLIIFSIFYLQIQARESEFFNKEVRYDTTKQAEPVRNGAPTKKQETPSTVNPQDRNGYGLYGHDPNQYPPTTTNNENYNAGNLPGKSPTDESTYTNNLYGNKQYGMSDTRYMQNGRYFYDVSNENYNRNRYESSTKDRYGNENYYPNGYGSRSGNRNGYEPTKGTYSRGKYNNEGYYGGNENAYEYNNTPMDGDMNQQEEYQNEYVP
eukprot:TRINITY_DN21153_c0_g1_i1.p1 TRINITY_DN21153_c0_g1~~TRINITY_DN21153_c0_g1_i1.p1  ORF type:complete len:220 (-),score=19.70 TRINITY_DN21153_c0_g1_i1:167-826(-)